MASEVAVTFLAPFGELAGRKQTTVALSEPVSGEALLRLLVERFPALAPFTREGDSHEDTLLLVINGHAARRTDLVRPGDEVLLCPQVSGG
jgi:molybdopterin converting factor small subunit